jgi:hypothetical protein
MHLALFLAALLWNSWHASALSTDRGNPVFTVDGKPFYVYGAAFFYERTPRARWRADLERYRALGINTIDLYLIWNWHEPDAHTIDFDGHTNPQRDLPALLRLIHQLGFKTIVRPGPVIRNEWRNGGYPDWLLTRAAYHMPLHDVLEGRYPATATLQNAHADAAAGEWLRNPVHRRYAAAWLHDVLHAIAPWSHDVIAIALDDDQGAYIDNDTWPAPHWHAYLGWLAAQVRVNVGPRVPLFINTYQMRVTASAPVWAWGNWYQSDAYRIGDHDLSQLAFSLGLLQTQTMLPVMTSEFQAGWLQGADEIAPRAAAPENTTLALHEMLQMGAHGVVNFPLQDTRNPAGYEAPWANAFYGWDAALDLDGNPTPRSIPTAAFGRLVQHYGTVLATMQPRSDVAIAWLGSAYAHADFASLESVTIAQQARCRALVLTCRILDLRYASAADLERTPVLVIPADPTRTFVPSVAQRLAAYRGRVVATVDAARATSSTGGLRDAALLVAPDGKRALLDIFNAATTARITPATSITLGGRRYAIPTLRIAPGDARDLALGFTAPPVPPATALPHLAPLPVRWRAVSHGTATAYELDVYHDGSPTYVLDNGRVRIVISADAGARAFLFEDLHTQRNAFTSIGALRDDVATPLPPSPRDYIAAYTHPFPAGTFNRSYACAIEHAGASALLRCRYQAPDLAATPVRFEKTVVLGPNATAFTVRLRATADAVSYSTFARPDLRAKTPYTLVRTAYPAGATEVVRFTLQGATAQAPKPGESP